MKKLIIGLCIVVVALLISFISSDFTLLYKITGAIAFISLIVSALLSGAFLDGERLGRNLQSESKEDRNQRFTLTNSILLIGLPNLLISVVSYFLMK
ncbi:hypothetical protein F4694_004281 [Bacillus niacini]|uniref:DUF5316 domain-containing protein n=1 Tax=Neobacillus niacini TaxID=86668 RepID=A0A852TF15_9BACI|nr:DUF5316 domain-containing protein [Neobacillus niacini]NYE07470.1 hypothetical protein [Neobacillus niacini]